MNQHTQQRPSARAPPESVTARGLFVSRMTAVNGLPVAQTGITQPRLDVLRAGLEISQVGPLSHFEPGEPPNSQSSEVKNK